MMKTPGMKIGRRSVVLGLSASGIVASVGQGATTLQDMALGAVRLPEVRVYRAKKVLTMAPGTQARDSAADTVAILGDRVLTTGSYDAVIAAIGPQQHVVDDQFADKILIAGLIDQHLHPLLSALTMTLEIIAIEDWNLPTGLSPAALSAQDYIARLTQAEAAIKDPDAPLLTWGYHHYFHGLVRRPELDAISATRPIMIWHRSAHEFVLNSPALELFGLDDAFVSTRSDQEQGQIDLETGHFYEAGAFAIMPSLAPVVATPERLIAGLELTRDYLHRAGITMTCEPGGVLSKPLQDAQNRVLGGSDVPFRTYYLADGKTLAQTKPANEIVAAAKSVLDWGEGKTAYLPDRVKLFADGAIYSQLMKMSEPYLDGHGGEWIMEPALFNKAFQTYWEAGYQIHIHQNGDAGLDMVLDALEMNMRRTPRHDHRTVIVHFGYARPEQVDKIKALGAIVSANPYYVTALADRYGEIGMGPERADELVRLGDVDRAGVSISFHSDMPMAPAQPLFLAWAAVNRLTVSGRVAGPEQRISVDRALRAITIDAAFSLGLEKEIGSLEPGKLANLTVLEQDPYEVDPETLKDIPIWGTIHEGRIFPVGGDRRKTEFSVPRDHQTQLAAVTLAGKNLTGSGAGCGCCNEPAQTCAPAMAEIPVGRANPSCCSSNTFGWLVSAHWAQNLDTA